MKTFHIKDTEDHLTPEGVAKGSRLASAGTVLMLVRGMTLLNDVPICVAQQPMAFNQDVKSIEAGPDILPEFLPYLLLGHKSDLLGLVELAGHGTGKISLDRLASYILGIPPLLEQRTIAGILGALDDKIELNRRMNRTLEEIARTIFTSWFVRFDPVRVKVEGRQPEGMDPETAALFPDAFIASTLGPIPAAWSVTSIADLADIVGGGTPSTKDPTIWDGDFWWATPKDLSKLASPVVLETERKITKAGLAKISSGLLPIGTLLMSSRAPIGYLAMAEVPVAINQGFIAMKPKSTVSGLFLLYWAESAQEQIVGRANGSTFLEISKAQFRGICLAVPDEQVMSAFARIASPLFERVVGNTRETRTLTELRDTLLPKLLSGELRVPEAERTLAEVGA